jgi:hypothetical protein
MIILGVLLLPMAGCVVMMVYFLSRSENPPEIQEKIEQMQAELGPNSGAVMLVAIRLMSLLALLYLALGIWVRRGGKVSAILSLVMVALVTLGTAFNMLGGLASGGTNAAAGLCVFGPLVALDVLTIIWLAQAIGNAGQVKQYRDYQQKYWAYAQQQQQWPGGGYPGYYGQAGGAYPPPPPAAPTPPPPPSGPNMPGA